MNPWVIAGVVGAVGLGGYALYKKGTSVPDAEAPQESSQDNFSNPALLYSPPAISSGGGGGGGSIAGSGAPGLPSAAQIVAAATGQPTTANANSNSGGNQTPTSPISVNPNPGLYASNAPLMSQTAYAEVAREQVRGNTAMGLASIATSEVLGLADIGAGRDVSLATLSVNRDLGLANTASQTVLGTAAIGASVQNTQQTSWTDLLKGILGVGGGSTTGGLQIAPGGSLALNQSTSGITISNIAPPAPPQAPPSNKPKYLSSEIKGYIQAQAQAGVPINAVTINQWSRQYDVGIAEIGAAFGMDESAARKWMQDNPGVTNTVNTTGTGQSSQGAGG